VTTASDPLAHNPDEAFRACRLCGDLSSNPERCPGWLAHRTVVTFHAESYQPWGWENLVGSQDTLSAVAVELDRKRRRFPEFVTRLMAKVTFLVPVAESSTAEEELQQLVDGAVPVAPQLMRSWAIERGRALAAEARVRELEDRLPCAPAGDWADSEHYEVVGWWGVDGANSREDAIRKARAALAENPGCRAEARVRPVRLWDGGDSEFYGPWQTIPLDEQPA
jgi:hypothetical protein